jgi:hypothetical protein
MNIKWLPQKKITFVVVEVNGFVVLNEIHINCRMCLSMHVKRFIQLKCPVTPKTYFPF